MTTTSQIEVVSKRFLDTMRLAEVTGYLSYDAIVVIDQNERLEDDYFVLGITGRAGPVDWRSTPVEPATPVNGLELEGFDYVGLAFDTSTWDGSDLFLLEGTTFVIGTAKVTNAIKNSGLTNIECIPLAEFRTVYDDGDDT